VTTDRNRCLNLALAEYDSIERRLARRVSNSSDVSDFMQEVFVKLLTAEFPTDQSIESIKGFVWTIARNVATDGRRSDATRKKAEEYLLDLDPTGYGSLDGSLLTRQQLDVLYRIFRSLPHQQQRVIYLRKVEGLTQREIAARLGIKECTVESYISKASDRIERQLTKKLEFEEQQTVLGWLRRRTSHD